MATTIRQRTDGLPRGDTHYGVRSWRGRPLIVLSAANPWDEHRMADAQLAAALSHFARVLYVDPAQSVPSRIRSSGWSSALRLPRLSLIGPRTARLTPEGLPGLSRPRVSAANSRLIAHQVSRAVGRLGANPVALIEANLLSPIHGRIDVGQTIYWAQDDFVAMAPLVGVDPEIYRSNQEKLTQHASMIVAANPAVADAIESASGRGVELVPFGCDVDHFSNSRYGISAAMSTGTAVLMGTLNERLDLAMLAAVADSGVRLMIIGPKSPRYEPPEFWELVGRPNVDWIGERPFAEMPRYLKEASVGLVPYTHSPFNEASFPLKTLEYLAAGLPVVATDLPAIRWLNAPDTQVADSPAAFADAVRNALAASPAEIAIRRQRAQSTARHHTWNVRAERFAQLLGVASP